MHCVSLADCRVLRLREGAPLEVCDGSGTIAAAFLKGIGSNRKAFVETSQPAKTVSRYRHAVVILKRACSQWLCTV